MTEQQTPYIEKAWVPFERLEAAEKEIARMRAIMSDIHRLVHIPTPGRMGAYTHFQRDFDQIRAMTKPFAVGAATNPKKEV